MGKIFEKELINPQIEKQILVRGKYQFKERLARLSQNPNIQIIATGRINSNNSESGGYTHFINYKIKKNDSNL